jgi:hypothetical protein
MEIPPVRGMISIFRGGNVMPMEIFVSCVGDLATLGVSLVAMTPVRSPPGSFSLSFFFVCEALGIRKFLPWQFPCTLAELSSWRGGDVSRMHEGTARYLDSFSAGV